MLVARWVVRTGAAVAAACASASLQTVAHPAAAGLRLLHIAQALLLTSGGHSLQLLTVQLYLVLLPVVAVHL